MKSTKALEVMLLVLLVVVIAAVGILYFYNIKPETKLAPEPEVIAKTVQEEATAQEPAKEPEPVPMPEAAAEEEKTLNIEISPESGYENTFDIAKGTEVIWTNPANVRRQITCYTGDDKNRGPTIFVDYAYESGSTVSYTFNDAGKFMCITNIYSLKWLFTVTDNNAPITGSAIFGFLRGMFS